MIYPTAKGGPGKGPNYKEFIITSPADVPNLPTSVASDKGVASIGSLAYTEDLEHSYILSPEDERKEV